MVVHENEFHAWPSPSSGDRRAGRAVRGDSARHAGRAGCRHRAGSPNRVTTISFPGPIAAIDAVGVTADGKTPGQFQLAHAKGSSFVPVRALTRKAATNLNIRWNKRTYVFKLIESYAPVLALNLEDRPGTEIVQPAPQVTPTRLIALLDKAKAFPLRKKQQPDASQHLLDVDATGRRFPLNRGEFNQGLVTRVGFVVGHAIKRPR